MYLKLNNNTIEQYPYSPEQLRADNPDTSFPAEMPAALLEEFGVYEVAPVDVPAVSSTQIVSEGTPVFDGQWKQSWVVREMTSEELQARVPAVATMRQARLALLQIGKLDDVTAAIDAMSEPQKSAAQIEWEYALTVERNSALLQALAAAIGLTDQDLNDLFTLAVTL